jgi:transposase-like protein
MAIDIVCPRCERDDDLRGRPIDGGLIELTCDSCRVQWTRDPRPRCPTCGGDDLYHVPQVIVEKSRGSQMSRRGRWRPSGRRPNASRQVEQATDAAKQLAAQLQEVQAT